MAASKGIPGNVLELLSAADKRQGFPDGTMASVMQQEVGGQFDKYLGDPAAYHYQAGPDGRRVAPQSGKVSTAFGPFGIVESTAAAPGYGVQPLQSKDLGEQIRFASDYLGARSKGAGGLAAGLAGYGEGDRYAQQVLARRDIGGGRGSMNPAPAQVVAKMDSSPPQDGSVDPNQKPPDPPVQPVAVAQAPSPAAPEQGTSGQEAWQKLQQALAQQQAQPVQVADLQSFGMPGVQVPNFQAAVAAAPRAIDFRSFGRWGARA